MNLSQEILNHNFLGRFHRYSQKENKKLRFHLPEANFITSETAEEARTGRVEKGM
ncbi:hypothetical protein ACX8XN_06720 [Calditrichota bacterium GD2]